jgi:hypothetical protein
MLADNGNSKRLNCAEQKGKIEKRKRNLKQRWNGNEGGAIGRSNRVKKKGMPMMKDVASTEMLCSLKPDFPFQYNSKRFLLFLFCTCRFFINPPVSTSYRYFLHCLG